MARLTPEIQNSITAFLRAGGFPEVAAAAAGVPAAQFARWMYAGTQPGAKKRYREFAAAVGEALGQARLKAEVAIHENKPLDWLKAGPGRADWGSKARPPAGPPALEHPAFQALLSGLLAALEPFPEAREAAAQALGR